MDGAARKKAKIEVPLASTSKDGVLAIVSRNGRDLAVVPSEWKDDKDIVLAAVKHTAMALQFASETLKGDIDVVTAATTWKDNPHYRPLHFYVKELMPEERWKAFRYASDALKAHKGMVLAAVAESGHAFQFASETLKADKDVVLAALRFSESSDTSFIHRRESWRAFEYAADALKGDKDVVLAAVAKSGHMFQHASDALKGDKEVILAVMSLDREDSTHYWYDPWQAFVYVSDALKGDKDVVLAAVSKSGQLFQCASAEMRADKEVALAAIAQGDEVDVLQYAAEALRNDKEVLMAAVQLDGEALHYASPTLRQDRELVHAALTVTPLALLWAYDDVQFIREMMALFPSNYFDELFILNVTALSGQSCCIVTGVEPRGHPIVGLHEEVLIDSSRFLGLVSDSTSDHEILENGSLVLGTEVLDGEDAMLAACPPGRVHELQLMMRHSSTPR